MSTTEDGVYFVRFLDEPIKLPLPPARYMTSTGAVRGSRCLQVHEASAFPQGIQCNVDESRGAAVVSWLPRRRRRQFSVFLVFSPWVVSGVFCFLRSGFSSWGSLGCFLSFKVRVWCVSCLISLGFGCFLRFFFFVLPTPLSQCWAMVCVIGPLN